MIKRLTLVTFCLMLVASNLWAKDISIMTYNLENLFDTEHDKGKEDWTYLPLKFKRSSEEVQKYCRSLSKEYYRKDCFNFNWSKNILDKKMQNLAEVIKEYNNGQGADILAFDEVENINVITELFETYLSDLGYQVPILIEGPDGRGIDVAIVSKLPLVEKKYHYIDLSELSNRNTRGILEATFDVDGKKITVFANHWPSQGNPDSHRLKAAETLRKATDALPTGNIAVAMGDFNTLPDDFPHGINKLIASSSDSANPYIDILKTKEASQMGLKGSHWYRGKWSMLDRIFLLKNSVGRDVEIKWNTLQIIKKPYMVHTFSYRDYKSKRQVRAVDVPRRFDEETGEGYSDHLPVALTLSIK